MSENLKKYLPILDWARSYNADWLLPDILAGLTVGVMLIPQGMAYALIAGLPPIYGLYASIVPLLIYAIFGTSRQLGVGPVALVSLMVGAAVASFSPSSVEETLALSFLLSFMVGLFTLLMGVLRLGFVANFLSNPVVSGFTSAAAVVIGFNQIKHILGIEVKGSKYIAELFTSLMDKVQGLNLPTLLLGLGGVLLLLLLKKINRKIPGALVLVVVAIAISYFFGLVDKGVKIVGNIPSGLPGISFSFFDINNISKLIPATLAISFVGFIETMAVAKSIRKNHRDYKLDANQELIALGLSNFFGSFFQSYPITGGFSRTAVNDEAGAKTPLSLIVSAVLVAFGLLFLTNVLFYLPLAVLGSIILVAISRLFHIEDLFVLYKTDKRDFFMWLATFFATLFLGVEKGIGIGIGLSVMAVIYESSKPHIAVTGKLLGTPHYRNIQRFPQAELRNDVLVFRFDSSLYFANADFFMQKVEDLVLEKGPELKLVVLNAVSVNGMDSTGADALREVVEVLDSQGIVFYIAGVIEPVLKVLEQNAIADELGREYLFLHPQDAVEYFDSIK